MTSTPRPDGWVAVVPFVLIVLVALAVRVAGLTSLPVGFHGDEAVVGLEAQRILREGSIGAFSPFAQGQPTGPIYLVAVSVALLGNTILAVRIVPALLGTLTVVALYFVARREVGLHVALVAAALLALMGWHIHYSRIGFPLASWPLIVVLLAGALAAATRTGHWGWWSAAGALAGAGIHTYNAHPLVILIVALAIVVHVLRDRWRPGPVEARLVGVFTIAMIVAMLPMLWFIATNTEQYIARFEREAVQEVPDEPAFDGAVGRARYMAVEYAGYWNRLCCAPELEAVDASGVTRTVAVPLLVLAAVGIVVGALRFRSNLITFGILITLVMPFGAVLTHQAELRRTLVIAPFLALFAAIALVEAVRYGSRVSSGTLRVWTIAAATMLVVLIVAHDARNYFVTFADATEHRWVFVEDFIDATEYMATLPDDAYVYFYADRWSIDYEPRRFLAPDVRGENRSESRFTEGDRFAIDPNQQRPVFVLIGRYRDELPRIQQAYPGGRVVYGGDEADPSFIAYERW